MQLISTLYSGPTNTKAHHSVAFLSLFMSRQIKRSSSCSVLLCSRYCLYNSYCFMNRNKSSNIRIKDGDAVISFYFSNWLQFIFNWLGVWYQKTFIWISVSWYLLYYQQWNAKTIVNHVECLFPSKRPGVGNIFAIL